MPKDDMTTAQMAFSFEEVASVTEPTAAPVPPPARSTPPKPTPPKPTPPKPTPPQAAPAKPAPLTLAQLRERIRTDEGLPKSKRKDWLSRLSTLFRVTGTDLSAPLDRARLIGQLDHLASGHRGLSRQSIYNIRSAVHGIADRYGIAVRRPRPADLSEPWQAIYQGSDARSIWRPISSLAYWADARDRSPDTVDQALFEAFVTHLQTETLEQKPLCKALLVVRAWNRLVEASPDLGLTPLVWENRRQRVSRDWEDFPPAFREALERYRRERLKPPLASRSSAPACKPATVDTHIAGIRRAASVLLDTGIPAEQLTGIAVLCAPGVFERWVEAYYQQLGPDRCDGLFNIVASLRAWAHHTGQIDADQHRVMSQTLQRLGQRKPGLTEKNRARLRPFTDPAVQRAWLHLGETLLAKADQQKNPKKRALLLQGALMHELLLIAPIRLGNLCGLHLDRHLRWEGKGRRRRVVLILPAGEVKNSRDLEFELPPRVVALLDRYLAEARPRLCADPTNRFLWPGNRDGRKHEVSMRQQMTRAVAQIVGVAIHPHLYRHLAAFFFLKAQPGAFEALRQLLGHKDLTTTMAYYVEIDRLWVSQQWGQTLEVLRDESRSDGRRR